MEGEVLLPELEREVAEVEWLLKVWLGVVMVLREDTDEVCEWRPRICWRWCEWLGACLPVCNAGWCC